MNDRFEMGSRIVCIKEYEKLKVGYHYVISGCGNLEFNSDPMARGKKGYGFSIKIEEYNYKNPYKVIWYYFTKEEMYEYFITEGEDYKAYIRDRKIREITDNI